jgi:Flp pilus assembly protein TadG
MTARARPRVLRGQALVEFALVFPLFLLFLFGLIEVGRVIYLYNAFNEAAREAARYASVEQWQYDCPKSVASPSRIGCTEQVARDRIAGAPAGFTVHATCSTSACRTNDLLTVTISTNSTFRFLTPIVGQVVPAPVISGQAQVVIQ